MSLLVQKTSNARPPFWCDQIILSIDCFIFCLGFYECMILLNSRPSNLCKNKEISNCNLPTRLSFAKDYFETATEICYSSKQ